MDACTTNNISMSLKMTTENLNEFCLLKYSVTIDALSHAF